MKDLAAALPRSYLYVPGHRSELVAKALETEADAVVIYLEDSVPADCRGRARSTVATILRRALALPVWVRINPCASGLAREDVQAAASPHLAGLRVAKSESAQEICTIAGWLAELEPGHSATIHCLIESALGLERAFELASAHPMVSGIALGEADLAADLGTHSDAGLLYARSRCVAAARAAGLASPVQSVFTDIRDHQRLRSSTEAGRDLGFFGRMAIHPSQVAIINEIYTPSRQSVLQARQLVERLEQSSVAGVAAFLLADGRFVDPAVVASARRTLVLARRLGIEA